jgi:arylesterase/paraoxonase
LNASQVTASKNGIYRFDTNTQKVTKLSLGNFDSLYTTHGIDVWVDRTHPDSPKVSLFIINHRPPVEGDAALIGADSVVELFETTLDGTSLRHVHTYRHDAINTPNDVVATSPTSFYVTNGEPSFLLLIEG